jgi:hypothetical protein
LRYARCAALSIAIASTIHAATAAETSRDLFLKTWEGKTIVVKQTLYTLVYNERGRLGKTYRNKRAGLIVVTPFTGSYLQFDGRQSQDDIIDQDPQRLVDTIKTTYQSDALDVRQYQKIEPIVVARYEVGSELLVGPIRIEGNIVRLSLVDPRSIDDDGQAATELTVKWPTPLSKSLSERQAIEGLIAQFVRLKQTA